MNALYSRGGAFRSKAGEPNGLPLDTAAYEAIERFARIMIRCGFRANAVAEAFGLALASTQGEMTQMPPATDRELVEASHLVTLWCSTPDYRDEYGMPIPLPARGPRRSLDALARRVSRSLDVEEMLRYLVRTRTVRKVGQRYVLHRRWVMLRGISGSAHSRSIRGLNGMLRTLDHNLLAQSDTESWFEFTAENPRFPVSQLEAFDKLARRTGLGSLRKLDLFMQQCEAGRRPNEPTVWLGVGMHLFQQDQLHPASSNKFRESKKLRNRASKRRRK